MPAIVPHKKSMIKIIRAFYPDAKIYLFGSYARDSVNQERHSVPLFCKKGLHGNIYKRENFKIAHAALERMIILLHNQPVDPENDLYWSAVMSVIKGFELCYETCWKFLKHCLLEQYKVEALSPKMVFRLSADIVRHADIFSKVLELCR